MQMVHPPHKGSSTWPCLLVRERYGPSQDVRRRTVAVVPLKGVVVLPHLGVLVCDGSLPRRTLRVGRRLLPRHQGKVRVATAAVQPLPCPLPLPPLLLALQ